MGGPVIQIMVAFDEITKYFHIPSKSPVSATIVVIAFKWSNVETIFVFFNCGSLIFASIGYKSLGNFKIKSEKF